MSRRSLREQMGNKKIVYYKDCDLSVGSVINIFNRKFVLYDSDEFTKEYYRVKYGISEYSRFQAVRIVEKFTVFDFMNLLLQLDMPLQTTGQIFLEVCRHAKTNRIRS